MIRNLPDVNVHVGATAPPSEQDAVWLDTSVLLAPVWKVYLSGSWRTVAGGTAAGVTSELVQSLPALTQAMAGDVTAPSLAVSGTLTQTLAALTQSVTGDVALPPTSGTLGQTLPALTQAMAATSTEPAVGLSIVGTSTTTPTSSQSSTSTCDKPSGTAEGMLLLAFVRIANILPGTDASNVTPPSGWTFLRLDSDSAGNPFRSHSIVYYKIAGASEPVDYTWSGLSSAIWQIGVHAIDGHDGIDTSGGAGATSTSTMTLPSISPSVAGCLLIASWSGWRSGRTSKWGTPSGGSLAEIYNLPATATADVIGAMDAQEILASAGATGTRESVNSGTCDRLCGSMVAIAPA